MLSETCKIMLPFSSKMKSLDSLYSFGFPNNSKVAVFMHGSSGFGHTSLLYMKFLARNGFIVIAPDHIQDHINHHKISYSSTPSTACSSKNQSIYKYIINYRLKEIRDCISFIKKKFLDPFIISFGTSEGAIAVSASKLFTHIKVICSFNIKPSYFLKHNYYHRHKQTTVINIYGSRDEFFSQLNSVSSFTDYLCGGNSKPLHNVHTLVINKAPHDLIHNPYHRQQVFHFIEFFTFCFLIFNIICLQFKFICQRIEYRFKFIYYVFIMVYHFLLLFNFIL